MNFRPYRNRCLIIFLVRFCFIFHVPCSDVLINALLRGNLEVCDPRSVAEILFYVEIFHHITATCRSFTKYNNVYFFLNIFLKAIELT